MKKEHVLIPEPNSKFLKINCKECEKENIVYSHSLQLILRNLLFGFGSRICSFFIWQSTRIF